MAGEVNLGTIAAHLSLQTGQFFSALETAGARLSVFGATAETQLSKVAGHGVNLSTAMLAAGAGIAAGLGVAVKAGADWQKTLTSVGNNTTMTSAQIRQMSIDVQDLGSKSAAPLDQLAEGYMHVINFGWRPGAEALGILTEAQKSAVATGGNAANTANILAGVLHEFGMQAGEAGRAMNMLHLAAAQGNMTLEQFDQAAGPAFAMAANLGVSVNDAAAAMSALTRHGFNAADAATQVRNIMAHIVAPAHAVREEIAKLSKITGIDLVRDFTSAGLHARGLSGVMADLAAVHEKTGIDIMKLIPAMRGGVGAMALAGTGARDYRDILASLADAMAGRVNPSAEGFARTQATLAAQTQILKNNLVILSAAVLTAVGPAITSLTRDLSGAIDAFNRLPSWVKTATVDLAALAAGALMTAGAVIKLAAPFMVVVGWVSKLGPLLAPLTAAWGDVTLAFTAVAGGAATVGEGLAVIVAALGGPVTLAIAAVVLASAGLYKAWTSDWGGIREKTQAAVSWLKTEVPAAWHQIAGATSAAWTGIAAGLAQSWSWIQGEFTSFGHALIAGHEDEWRQITSVVSIGAHAVGDVLDRQWTAIRAASSATWHWLSGEASATWRVIATAASAGWSVIQSQLQVTWHVLTAAFGVVMRQMESVWHVAWEGIKTAGMVAWTAITALVRINLTALAGVVRVGLDLLTGHWSRAWQTMEQTGRAIWGEIRQAWSSILQQIVHLVTGFGGQLLQAGRGMVHAFATGIESAAAAPVAAVQGMVAKVASLLPHSDAAAGPLSRLTASGRALPETFAAGIRAGAPAAHAALTGMFAGLGGVMDGWIKRQAGGSWLGKMLGNQQGSNAQTGMLALDSGQGTVWGERPGSGQGHGSSQGLGGILQELLGGVGSSGKGGQGGGLAAILAQVLGGSSSSPSGGSAGILTPALAQVLGGSTTPPAGGFLQGILGSLLGGMGGGAGGGGGLLGGMGGGAGGGGGLLGGLLSGLGPWGGVASMGIGLLGGLFGGGGYQPQAPKVDRPGAGDTIHVNVDATGAFLPDQRSVERLAEMVATKTRSQIRMRTSMAG
jgi:TP901 family phage tail tape measure protein